MLELEQNIYCISDMHEILWTKGLVWAIAGISVLGSLSLGRSSGTSAMDEGHVPLVGIQLCSARKEFGFWVAAEINATSLSNDQQQSNDCWRRATDDHFLGGIWKVCSSCSDLYSSHQKYSGAMQKFQSVFCFVTVKQYPSLSHIISSIVHKFQKQCLILSINLR